jgi:hypothetical protein
MSGRNARKMIGAASGIIPIFNLGGLSTIVSLASEQALRPYGQYYQHDNVDNEHLAGRA